MRVVHGMDIEENGLKMLPHKQGFISVEPSNLVVTALKKAELGDGLILRFYNATDESVDGVIRTHKAVKTARVVNLNEVPLPDGEIDLDNNNTIHLKVEGHEIKTVELGFL
jgi:alpha-mannosidase